MTHWQKLIKRYVQDKKICNCGRAYETLHKDGAILGGKKIDNWACAGGCQAAQFNAKEYVAKQVLNELKSAEVL